MGLKERILEDIKGAMKAQDALLLQTLRFLHSSIKNKEIAIRPNKISEDDVIKVIRKLSQQTRDVIQQSEKAGREDLVNKAKGELKVFESYLPPSLSLDEIKAVVQKSMDDLKVDSVKKMGLVVKDVISQTKGRADNKLISQIVRERLESL